MMFALRYLSDAFPVSLWCAIFWPHSCEAHFHCLLFWWVAFLSDGVWSEEVMHILSS